MRQIFTLSNSKLTSDDSVFTEFLRSCLTQISLITVLFLSSVLSISCAQAEDAETCAKPEVFFCDDFEGADQACWSPNNRPNSGGWNYKGCGSWTNIGQADHVSLAVGEVAKSGNKAMKITFTSDENFGGGHIIRDVFSTDHLFVRQWTYFAKDFDFAANQKILRINSMNGGIGLGPVNYDIVALQTAYPDNGNIGDFHQGITNMKGLNMSYNGGPNDWGSVGELISFQRERWYCMEVEIKLNSPGSSNGEVRLWVDGNLLKERSGINIRGNRTENLNTVLFGGWYSNGAAGQNPYVNPAVPAIRYIDDVVISRARIGCADVPPGAPKSIRIQKIKK